MRTRHAKVLAAVCVALVWVMLFPAGASADDDGDDGDDDNEIALCHEKKRRPGVYKLKWFEDDDIRKVNRHLRKHNDGFPGDPVPRMAGFTFGDDCVPVADAPSGMVLDAFNDGPFSITGPSEKTFVAATVPGGFRDVFLLDSSQVVTPTVMSQVAGNDYLDISVGDAPNGYKISYGGPTSLVTHALNLDLTADGATDFVLLLGQAGEKGRATIRVSSGCTGTSPFSPFSNCVTDSSFVGLIGAGAISWGFGGFSGVDFTDVDHIQITFDSGLVANQNIRLDEFRTATFP